MERLEELREMPYVTSAEPIDIEKGLQQGGRGVLGRRVAAGAPGWPRASIKLKFGPPAEEILPWAPTGERL
jgi:hypothetical protein